MSVRDRRLSRELELMQDLLSKSSLISFVPKGAPPDEYLVSLRCLGMADGGHLREEHLVRIYLHADYPRLPPKVTILTPCFHPNIAAPIQIGSVQRQIQESLEQAPDEESRRRLVAELDADRELFEGHVCLDALDYNWSPAITLPDICTELAEMIQYKRFNVDDPLNPEAAHWARLNSGRFPIDRRRFLNLGGLAGIRILDEEPGEDALIRVID